MRVLGRLQTFRAVVSEPEPGRVLVETNDNGYITTFTVEPQAEGQQAYVTIATEMTGRAGMLGTVERWFVRWFMRRVFVRKLEQLAAVHGGDINVSSKPGRTCFHVWLPLTVEV